MINSYFNFSKNKFIKDVITLTSGTVISQIIVILSSPLLSRIFLVKSFGELAIFTSFTSFFAVLSTGRYELAIGLPSKDDESKAIIKLIMCISVIISFLYLLLIFFLRDIVKIKDTTQFLNLKISYLAPFYIFLIAIYSAFSYWKQRKKKYKDITIAVSVQVISTTAFSLFIGYFLHIQNGMVLSLIIGMTISILYFIYSEKFLFYEVLQQKKVSYVMKKYISFPKYMTFSDLSMVASQQFLPIVFSILYNSTIVGYYAMANRIVRLPSILVTSSIANVFRNEAIEIIQINGNCKKLYITTFKKLFILSATVNLFLFIFSPMLFELVLGKQWVVAGKFARIISIFLFVEFLTIPLNTIYIIRGKQKLQMTIQLSNAFFGFLMLFLGNYIYSSVYVSLIFFTINSVFFNLFQLYFSYKISKFNLLNPIN